MGRVIEHRVRVWPSAEPHARGEQLAWKLAEVAAERVEPDADVVDIDRKSTRLNSSHT